MFILVACRIEILSALFIEVVIFSEDLILCTCCLVCDGSDSFHVLVVPSYFISQASVFIHFYSF